MSIKINKVFWKRIQVYFEIQKSLKFNFYLKLINLLNLDVIKNIKNPLSSQFTFRALCMNL